MSSSLSFFCTDVKMHIIYYVNVFNNVILNLILKLNGHQLL